MKQSFLKKMNQAFLVALICMMLFMTIFVSVPIAIAQSSSDTTVYIDPPYKEAFVNQTFSISVSITNVTDLFFWNLKLWYTTAHIDVISVTEGPFLKADGAETSFGILEMNDAYNATHGFVLARCMRPSKATGVSGSGVLATVYFNATSLGNSDLLFAQPGRLYPVRLRDSKLKDMACNATGGTIEVKTSISPYSPTASFTVPPTNLYTGKSITFDASASKTGCNGTHPIPITLYSWNFGDGSTSNGTNPILNHTYALAGNYNVTLTVYAPGATPETDTTTHTIRVVKPTMVFVDPPLIEVTVNQTFSVSVRIANVTNLYAYDFKLYYNTTVLDGISINILPGLFFEPANPSNIFLVYAEVNDRLGFIWLAISLLNPELPKNGNGTLATIKFKATALGSSNLTLYYPDYPYPVMLSNRKGAEIPCNTASGTVNVMALLGDINADGGINEHDLIALAKVYGAKPSDPKWNPQADLYPDGRINIFDLVIIARNYGKTWTP